MAASFRPRLGGKLDEWSVREKLALGCCVMKNGDQNWASVSKAVRPYGDPNRPMEWFSSKNCAQQYTDLLEKAETPKRKRGDKGEIETPRLQIVRKLTIERMEELKKKVVEQQQRYKALKKDVEAIKSGEWDDKLPESYEQLLRERQKAEEEAKAAEQRMMEEAAASLLNAESKSQTVETEGSQAASQPSDVDAETETEDTQDSVISHTQSEETALPTSFPGKIENAAWGSKSKQTPTGSQCLSKLLSSKLFSADDLTTIKQKTEREHEKAQAAAQSSVPATVAVTSEDTDTNTHTVVATIVDMDQTPSSAAPTLTKILQKSAVTTSVIGSDQATVNVKSEPLDPSSTVQITQEDSDMIVEIEDDVKKESEEEEEIDPAEEGEKKEESATVTPSVDNQEESQDSPDPANTSYASADEEVTIKDEPLSPSSSISSKISESDSRRDSRRFKHGKTSKGNKRRSKRTKKQLSDDYKKDDETSRLSDADTSDDGAASDDNTSTTNMFNVTTPATFSESIPNSPLSHCSDTEDEKAYKNWKKSIMLVWRSAANHKYANVFLHPVTNEIAPGYSSVVHRPMDLSVIKKKIESGETRTTVEFQRDMMLMFTNAIMYNSSNHDVYKMATNMYEEVMQQIELYVSTQLMVQSTDSKYLRGSRRSDNSDKEDETKRRRTSSEQHSEGGKTKKRKTRADDT